MSYGQKTEADLKSNMLSFLSLKHVDLRLNLQFFGHANLPEGKHRSSQLYWTSFIKKIWSNQAKTMEKII